MEDHRVRGDKSTTKKPFEDKRQRLAENMAGVKHKIMVMSGKGGVGKSTVAVNLAYGLALNGLRVGVLDVDIHGPNIAKMFGAEGKRLYSDGNIIFPLEVVPNVRIMSIAFVLESSTSAVVWRGPLKMKAIEQFLGDVKWGELDCLIVDAPPGTGDEPLSVAQLIPDMDGAVIVTTPQDLSLLDARKTVTFARLLEMPVLGIVENMSGLICPYCGKRIDLFKTGGGERAAEEMGVSFLGRVPIEPAIVESEDEGRPFIYEFGKTEAAKAFDELTRRIIEILNAREN